MTLHIKILGGGCANCDRLAAKRQAGSSPTWRGSDVREERRLHGVPRYSLLATPGLVVNDKLLSGGRVPSPEQIVTMLANVLAGGRQLGRRPTQ